jgi:hypothetical protein
MIKNFNRMCRVSGLILIATSLFAQTFDVISIKSNTSGEKGTTMRPEPGGRFVVVNTPAITLLRVAFGGKSPNGLMPDFQIVPRNSSEAADTVRGSVVVNP